MLGVPPLRFDVCDLPESRDNRELQKHISLGLFTDDDLRRLRDEIDRALNI
jgi:hypothetical protein